MTGDEMTPLDELRWHWGEAYLIDYLGEWRWVAQRRDTGATLRAESPHELRDLIVEDYTAHPVSRQVSSPAPRGESWRPRLAPDL